MITKITFEHKEFLEDRKKKFPYTDAFTAFYVAQKYINEIDDPNVKIALQCVLDFSSHPDREALISKMGWYDYYTNDYEEFLKEYKHLGTPFDE